MLTTINDVSIHVIPMNSRQVIFLNGDTKAYFMEWNPRKYCWQFVAPEDVLEQLVDIENEISNFIIKSERQTS